MKTKISLLIILCGFISIAQTKNFISNEVAINEYIDGTLLIPNDVEKPNLAILIGGSGPTDRDGNQNFLKNNPDLVDIAEEIEIRSINISMSLPGAAPQEVEEGITIKVEEAVQDLEGIPHNETVSAGD